MQKWEYMWIYMSHEQGRNVFVANGVRLAAQAYPEALNAVGKEGWELVTTIITPHTYVPTEIFPTQTFPQFCLKRPISD
jgi:hypothetical protein